MDRRAYWDTENDPTVVGCFNVHEWRVILEHYMFTVVSFQILGRLTPMSVIPDIGVCSQGIIRMQTQTWSPPCRSMELLQLRRDRVVRADSVIDKNQALVLSAPNLLPRLMELLRIMNYNPPLAMFRAFAWGVTSCLEK